MVPVFPFFRARFPFFGVALCPLYPAVAVERTLASHFAKPFRARSSPTRLGHALCYTSRCSSTAPRTMTVPGGHRKTEKIKLDEVERKHFDEISCVHITTIHCVLCIFLASGSQVDGQEANFR